VSALIYTLCALTAALCAVLLLRAYSRTRTQMLFWSGLCFLGLTVSNILLVLDRIVLPTTDLSTARLSASLVALLLLIYGLVMGED
jgi:FtsH-binding integral membrane protein